MNRGEIQPDFVNSEKTDFMKNLLFIPLFLFAFSAVYGQKSDFKEQKESQHFYYIEANIEYDRLGRPGKPFLNVGEQLREMLPNYRDFEQKVASYKSNMDIINYLDEQGYEFIDRQLFTWEDTILESMIFRKPR